MVNNCNNSYYKCSQMCDLDNYFKFDKEIFESLAISIDFLNSFTLRSNNKTILRWLYLLLVESEYSQRKRVWG